MSDAPVANPDFQSFIADPYPFYHRMRHETPIARIPMISNAYFFSRYDDVATLAKDHERLSNYLIEDGMVRIMGQNMMRKDGQAHREERAAVRPTISSQSAKNNWQSRFETMVKDVLENIKTDGSACMVKDIAMRISAEALKMVTGLTQISWQEMDRVSQGMMDGVANVMGDPDIEMRANECVACIGQYVDEMMAEADEQYEFSLIATQLKAGLNDEQIKANVRLAISGGQNEPRDALAGTVYALLQHPEQLQMILDGKATWLDAYEEYVRWKSPVGSVARKSTQTFEHNGITIEKDAVVLLSVASANRDEAVFANSDTFDLTRDTGKHLAFSVGAHFCAGTFISRILIASVSLPLIFERLKNLRMTGEAPFMGWAFRGLIALPVAWDC